MITMDFAKQETSRACFEEPRVQVVRLDHSDIIVTSAPPIEDPKAVLTRGRRI